MSEGLTYIVEGEATESLAGLEEASPFRPAGVSSKPVIQIHRAFPPPLTGSEGASELDAGVASLGSLAVRLVAEWSLPRMQMMPLEPGEAPAAPVSLPEEEERLRDW